MAASEAAKEAIYLRGFMKELGYGDDAATRLFVDNSGAIDLAYNPEHHERTKHIQRRHFFIRDCVEQHELVVPFVPSAENIADLFTKCVSPKQFLYLRAIAMNVPVASAWGGIANRSP